MRIQKPSAFLLLLAVAATLTLIQPGGVSADGPKLPPGITAAMMNRASDTLVLSPMNRKSDGPIAQALLACEGQTNDPHKSTHVPGTVNVVATTVCPSPQTTVHVETTLYKDVGGSWVPWGSTGSSTQFNAVFASANSAGTCQSGQYLGFSYHYVIFTTGQAANGYTYKEASVTC